MSDPYGKFSPGDAPPRSATRESKISEVLLWYAWVKDQIGGGAGSIAGDAGLIDVRNDTNQAVGEFAILGLDGVVFSPTANLSGFKSGSIFKGVSPTVADHDGNFCITDAPIAANSIGKARVAGVMPAQISVTNTTAWYEYADVTNSNTAVLTLLPAGKARVVYKESSNTGTTWGIVCLGVPPGDVTLMGKTDETINTGNAGNCSVYLSWGTDGGEVVSAENPASLGSDLNTNTDVSLTWLSHYRKWIAAGCSNTA